MLTQCGNGVLLCTSVKLFCVVYLLDAYAIIMTRDVQVYWCKWALCLYYMISVIGVLFVWFEHGLCWCVGCFVVVCCCAPSVFPGCF